MRYLVIVVLSVLIYPGSTVAQDYVFEGLAGYEYENPDSWVPVNTAVAYGNNNKNIQINSLCFANAPFLTAGPIEVRPNVSFEVYGRIENYSNIINYGYIIGKLSTMFGSVYNFGVIDAENAGWSQNEFINIDSHISVKGAFDGHFKLLDGSRLTIGIGEIGTINDKGYFRRHNRADIAYEQDSTSTIQFEALNPDNHTKMIIEGKGMFDGAIEIRADYTPNNQQIPKACGVYELITYDDHMGEFSSISFFENRSGWVTQVPISHYQINLKYFDDRMEMVTFYPETNSFTGTNSDWNNPSNWSEGYVPNACSNVVIPSGKQIVVNEGESIKCNSITLEEGANLQIDSLAKVTLYSLESY